MIRSRCIVIAGVFVREVYGDSSRLQGVPCSRVQFRTATAQRSISMRKQLAAAGVAALSLVNMAHAAIPAEVTAAMTEARTDGLSVAGTLLGIAVAVWGALYIKRKFFG